jgi:hypothetical protein
MSVSEVADILDNCACRALIMPYFFGFLGVAQLTHKNKYAATKTDRIA